VGGPARVVGPSSGYVLAMHGTSEPDVELDPKVARTREAGGLDADHPVDPAEGDAPATTGTGVNDEFVGRVAGQDLGYAGTTGAEARADDDSAEEER
jgi:hypothetical protein